MNFTDYIAIVGEQLIDTDNRRLFIICVVWRRESLTVRVNRLVHPWGSNAPISTKIREIKCRRQHLQSKSSISELQATSR
jgi:hypothetical protein